MLIVDLRAALSDPAPSAPLMMHRLSMTYASFVMLIGLSLIGKAEDIQGISLNLRCLDGRSVSAAGTFHQGEPILLRVSIRNEQALQKAVEVAENLRKDRAAKETARDENEEVETAAILTPVGEEKDVSSHSTNLDYCLPDAGKRWIDQVKMTMFHSGQRQEKVEVKFEILEGGDEAILSTMPVSAVVGLLPNVSTKLSCGEYIVLAECTLDDIWKVLNNFAINSLPGITEKSIGQRRIFSETRLTILPPSTQSKEMFQTKMSSARYWSRKGNSDLVFKTLEEGKRSIQSDDEHIAWLNLMSEEYEKTQQYQLALNSLREIRDILRKKPANPKDSYPELINMSIRRLEMKINSGAPNKR